MRFKNFLFFLNFEGLKEGSEQNMEFLFWRTKVNEEIPVLGLD
jgi:hypothetical protein